MLWTDADLEGVKNLEGGGVDDRDAVRLAVRYVDAIERARCRRAEGVGPRGAVEVLDLRGRARRRPQRRQAQPQAQSRAKVLPTKLHNDLRRQMRGSSAAGKTGSHAAHSR